MSELITIQVGQCGNQIGSKFWPKVLQEYGIKNVPGESIRRSEKEIKKNKNFSESFNSFLTTDKNFDFSYVRSYSDLKKYKVKARSILIDMEDGVLNRLHSGSFRNLFDKSNTIKNYPGSANNWAEGYFDHGSKYHDDVEKVLQRNVEKCDKLQGFNLFYSASGGTGSGLGSFVLEMLAENYPDIESFVTCVYSNGTEDVITSPYNMLLTTKWLSEFANCVFPVENRALDNIVRKQIEQKFSTETLNYVLNCKPYEDYNSVIVNMLLHLTSGSRFSGSFNMDMNDICSNLVPYPNLQFISSGYSPITLTLDKLRHSTSRKIHRDIFTECCSKKHQLLTCDPLGLNSKLLGTCLIGRGSYTIGDMRNYVEQIQNRGNFTIWSEKSIRIGLCNVSSAGQDASMLALFNTSSITSFFQHILLHFDKLYSRKAHVYHYENISGFDIDLFNESRETLINNIQQYNFIINNTNHVKPRLKYL